MQKKYTVCPVPHFFLNNHNANLKRSQYLVWLVTESMSIPQCSAWTRSQMLQPLPLTLGTGAALALGEECCVIQVPEHMHSYNMKRLHETEKKIKLLVVLK